MNPNKAAIIIQDKMIELNPGGNFPGTDWIERIINYTIHEEKINLLRKLQESMINNLSPDIGEFGEDNRAYNQGIRHCHLDLTKAICKLNGN